MAAIFYFLFAVDEEEQAFLSLPFVFQSRHKRKKGIGSASLTSSIRSFIDINPVSYLSVYSFSRKL